MYVIISTPAALPVTYISPSASWAATALPAPPNNIRVTVPTRDSHNVRMRVPFVHAGRVRQWLGAVQAAMIDGPRVAASR